MPKQSSDQIRCLLRKEWVAALPEEVVRQKLIYQMINQLGYPASNLVLEKSLKQIPHIAQQGVKLPLRRADILCFSSGIHPVYDLYPLLLIECKAVKLTSKVISQVAGYNHYLQAYYICVANQDEIRTGWYDAAKQEYTFVDRLPSYLELKNTLKFNAKTQR